MSTPVAAGAAALVRQYLEEGFHRCGARDESGGMGNPSAALVKAMLINSARRPQGGVTWKFTNTDHGDCQTYLVRPPPRLCVSTRSSSALVSAKHRDRFRVRAAWSDAFPGCWRAFCGYRPGLCQCRFRMAIKTYIGPNRISFLRPKPDSLPAKAVLLPSQAGSNCLPFALHRTQCVQCMCTRRWRVPR
jgi:hypothetical protein